jgi:hypothetical protein
MRGVNRVMLIGNLGKDPDVQHLEGNIAVAKFPLATTETFKDRNGKLVFANRVAHHCFVAGVLPSWQVSTCTRAALYILKADCVPAPGMIKTVTENLQLK